MSAGSGVTHSEFNPSKSETVHLLQIWIRPEAKGIAPSYEQKEFNRDDMRGKLHLIAAPDPMRLNRFCENAHDGLIKLQRVLQLRAFRQYGIPV